MSKLLDLPKEVKNRILYFLEQPDWEVCHTVSNQWETCASTYFFKGVELDLDSQEDLERVTMLIDPNFNIFSNLHTLKVENLTFTGADSVNWLCLCAHIKELYLEVDSLTSVSDILVLIDFVLKIPKYSLTINDKPALDVLGFVMDRFQSHRIKLYVGCVTEQERYETGEKVEVDNDELYIRVNQSRQMQVKKFVQNQVVDTCTLGSIKELDMVDNLKFLNDANLNLANSLFLRGGTISKANGSIVFPNVEHLDIVRTSFHTLIVIPQVFSQFDTISLRDCQLSGSENDDTYALDLSTANLTDLSLIFKKNDFFNYGVSSQGSSRPHHSGSHTLPRRRLFLQVNMVGQQTYMHSVFDDSTNTTMAVSRNDFKKRVRYLKSTREDLYIVIHVKLQSLENFS